MSNRRNTTRPRPQNLRRRPWQRWLRLPTFLPVPLRARRDGWTPARQARFIGLLAQTGCVRTAAAMLGLSRESAYRLRRRPGAGSFVVAWNTASSGRTQPQWKFTPADRMDLAQGKLMQVRLWRGRFAGVGHKQRVSAILALVSTLDRHLATLDARLAADPSLRHANQALFARCVSTSRHVW